MAATAVAVSEAEAAVASLSISLCVPRPRLSVLLSASLAQFRPNYFNYRCSLSPVSVLVFLFFCPAFLLSVVPGSCLSRFLCSSSFFDLLLVSSTL